MVERFDIHRQSNVRKSARLDQIALLFDWRDESIENHWRVEWNIDERPWTIGMIVGPSGSGKSTLLGERFGAPASFSWPRNRSILDAFPADASLERIIGALTSAGLASVPSWRQPFHSLSGGEQARATVARALAESRRLIAIDEFTSPLDRATARATALCLGRFIRREGARLVVATCHHDVEVWLDPDWIVDVATGHLTWRMVRRSPERRLTVRRSDRSAWRLFQDHHYLSGRLHHSARCFVGWLDESPAVFVAVLPFPHRSRSGFREHRLVCLPTFQGLGVGRAMSDYIASLFVATGRPYFSATTHPSVVRARTRSPDWKMLRSPSRRSPHRFPHWRDRGSSCRRLASFEYIGPARLDDARWAGLPIPSADSIDRNEKD